MDQQKQRLEICFLGATEAELPEGALLVSTNREYVTACQAIRDSAPRPPEVWVRDRAHLAWVQAYCNLIGLDCRVRELTPCLLLADKWHVSIPDWLDDATVVSEKLLDLDIATQDADDFVDVILGHFLDRAYCSPELHPDRIVELITPLVDVKTRPLLDQYSVLRRSLEEKCTRWEQKTESFWWVEFCQSLKTRPDALWHDLTLRAILGRYPKRLIEFAAAPQRAAFLRAVPLDPLTELPLHPAAVEVALDQIQLFFNNIEDPISSTEDLQKILSAVSGRLSQEFDLVEDLLEACPYTPQQKDIDLVREAFKTCPGVSRVKIDRLDRFVPPMKPSMPGAWEAGQWLPWALGEYLPYRHWQTQNGQFDDQVEKAACAFSDWYIEEYTSIHQDAEKSLVHLLTQWRERLLADDLSLILVVDCLPVWFWDLLETQLTGAGFHRHGQEYRFVPLPSHTEICKPSLLTGLWDKAESQYPDMLKERGKRDWPGKDVRYVPNLKALSELPLPEGSAVLVLNFLQVDQMLHADVESDGSTHREELFRLFARLVEAVKDIFERWQGQDDKFGVYVVTDHGATRILAEEKTSLDSKVVGRLFPDEKSRFGWIASDNVEEIPENLWSFGYRFKPPFTQQGAEFFIPKGHNTVKVGSKGRGFVHGGASPEEVIVPAAVFRPVKAAWKDPSIRFVDLRLDRESGAAVFYIQRVVSIKIEIQNLNPEEMRIVRMDVLNPDADVKAFSTCQIGSQEASNAELSCYFRKSALDEEELVLQLTYELAGEEHTMQVPTRAVFKSATTGGFNLKDLP